MPVWTGQFVQVAWSIVLESALWIMISLFFAGLIHEFLPSSRLKQLLNRKGRSATCGAVALGSLLPICSCGVIPIAVGLYRSGVRIGPVMAFTAATPIINPAAVILGFALLGKEITIAYLLLGLSLPFLLGAMAERFGGARTENPDAGDTASTCCSAQAVDPVVPYQTLALRLRNGLRWGFMTLGPTIGFYLAIGIALAAALNVALPAQWSADYLGAGSLTGLLVAALFGASIYVCAVAHIPLVATLLASGAGPGAAIVFLVTGTATNLPELFALYKTIGRRTVIIYVLTLIVGSLLAGVLVNYWLGADFVPVFDPLASLALIDSGERLWLTPSALANELAAWAVLLMAVWGSWLKLGRRLMPQKVVADNAG